MYVVVGLEIIVITLEKPANLVRLKFFLYYN